MQHKLYNIVHYLINNHLVLSDNSALPNTTNLYILYIFVYNKKQYNLMQNNLLKAYMRF